MYNCQVKKKYSVLVILACFLVNISIISAVADNTETVIARISDTYQPYLHVYAKWIETGDLKQSYEFFRDLNKGKLIVEDISSNSKNFSSLSRGEYLTIENESIIECVSEYNEMKEKIGNDLVYSYFKTPQDKFYSTFASTSFSAGMGILHGEWIPNLLKQKEKIGIQTDNQDGKDVTIVTFKDKNLFFRLFADPAQNYVVTKIEVEKEYPKQDVSLKDITLDELPPQIVKNIYFMEDFRLKNGYLVPHKIIAESKYSPYVSISPNADADGKSIVSRDKNGKIVLMPASADKTPSILEKIEFNFSFSNKAPFAFTIPIADGTKVHMKDVSHLSFMWNNGKIIPLTDEAILALRGQRFIPSPTEPRFWLMSVSFLMIILTICLIIHEYRKSKN
jgi:hypothetical protein